MRLCKFDMLRLPGEMRRPKHDKERIPVLLQLRPLVPAMGIFNGKVVQPKFFLDFAQQLLIGFE
jgi:hypothetical protein